MFQTTKQFGGKSCQTNQRQAGCLPLVPSPAARLRHCQPILSKSVPIQGRWFMVSSCCILLRSASLLCLSSAWLRLWAKSFCLLRSSRSFMRCRSALRRLCSAWRSKHPQAARIWFKASTFPVSAEQSQEPFTHRVTDITVVPQTANVTLYQLKT